VQKFSEHSSSDGMACVLGYTYDIFMYTCTGISLCLCVMISLYRYHEIFIYRFHDIFIWFGDCSSSDDSSPDDSSPYGKRKSV